MILALLIALAGQDVAAGTVVWGPTTPLRPQAPVVVAAPPPSLPAWALADPFGWERAQCSPLIRKDSLETCQARVRADLAANLGDALPDALKPASLENCRRTDDGFAVTCGAQERAARPAPVLREQDCGTRMTRQGEGAPGWTSECRPMVGDERRGDGLSIRLGGQD